VVFGCRHTATPVIGGPAHRTAGDGGVLPAHEYVELPCLGSLDVLDVLRALDGGAIAVLAVGCHEGRCRHLTGSQRAERVVGHVAGVLKEAGLDPGVVGLVLGSPLDGASILRAVRAFAEGIRRTAP